jgi:hypothetical protein
MHIHLSTRLPLVRLAEYYHLEQIPITRKMNKPKRCCNPKKQRKCCVGVAIIYVRLQMVRTFIDTHCEYTTYVKLEA